MRARHRRQRLGRLVALAWGLVAAGGPPVLAQSDLESPFLYAYDFSFLKRAQPQHVIFSERDHFEYYYSQFSGPAPIDDGRGSLSYLYCTGVRQCTEVWIPSFVCDVRMALERAKRYFDGYRGTTVNLKGRRIPVYFSYGPDDRTVSDGDTTTNLYGSTLYIQLRSAYERPSLGLATAIHEYFHVVQNENGWGRSATLREGTAQWATDEPIPLAVRSTGWDGAPPTTADMLNEYAAADRAIPRPHRLFQLEEGADTNAYLSAYFWKYYAEQIADSIGPGEFGAIIEVGLRAAQEELVQAVGRPFHPQDPMAGFQEIFGRYVTTMAAPRYRPDSEARAWMGLRDTAVGSGANRVPQENAPVRTPLMAVEFMNRPERPHVPSPDGTYPYQRDQTLPKPAWTDGERAARFRDQQRLWSWANPVQFGEYYYVSLLRPEAVDKPTRLWISIQSGEGGAEATWVGGVVKRRPDGSHAGLPQRIRVTTVEDALVVLDDFGARGGPEDYAEVLVGLANVSPGGAAGKAGVGFIVTPVFQDQVCDVLVDARTVCLWRSSSGNRATFTDGDEIEVRVDLSDRVHVSQSDTPEADQTTLRLEAVEPADRPERGPLALKTLAEGAAAAVRLLDATAFTYTIRFGLAEQERMPAGAYRVRLAAESLLRLGTHDGLADLAKDDSFRFTYRPPPPYVRRVVVRQGGELMYQAAWVDGTPGRAREGGVQQHLRADRQAPEIEIELTFSRMIGLAPSVRLGDAAVPMEARPGHTTWVGRVSPSALGLPEEGTGMVMLTLEIQASDEWNMELDTDPSTKPVPVDGELPEDPRQGWSGYEPSAVGLGWTETNHALPFQLRKAEAAAAPASAVAGECSRHGQLLEACDGDVIVTYLCDVPPEIQARTERGEMETSITSDNLLVEHVRVVTPTGEEYIQKPLPLQWREWNRSPCAATYEHCYAGPEETVRPFEASICEGDGAVECLRQQGAVCEPACEEICGYWRSIPLPPERAARRRGERFYTPCWSGGHKAVLCQCGTGECAATEIISKEEQDRRWEEDLRTGIGGLMPGWCEGHDVEWAFGCKGGTPPAGSR